MLKELPGKYRIVYALLRSAKNLLFWLPYIIYYKLRNLIKHDVIYSGSLLHLKGYSVCPYNWGDDINKFFFEYIANVKIAVMPLKNLFFRNTEYYMCIGSISRKSTFTNNIIYGSGLIHSGKKLEERPKRIISVRGPLTRKALIEQGLQCPEKYGDIALLLPLFYTPKIRSGEKKITIIPHFRTLRTGCDLVNKIAAEHNCNILSMFSYDKWTDIIDAIAGSSFVISESLHGLVVSETYNIPCVWVEFLDHSPDQNILGVCYDDWSFKFRDFYESIGKHDMQSVKLYEGYNFDELMTLRDKWKPGNIDYEKQLEYFPFEIKPEFKPQIAEFLRTHKNSPRS